MKLSTPKVVLIGDSLIQQIPNAPVYTGAYVILPNKMSSSILLNVLFDVM